MSSDPETIAKQLLQGNDLDEDENISSLYSLLMRKQGFDTVTKEVFAKRIAEQVKVHLEKHRTTQEEDIPPRSTSVSRTFSRSKSFDCNEGSSHASTLSGPGYTLVSSRTSMSRGSSFDCDSTQSHATGSRLSASSDEEDWGELDILDVLDGVRHEERNTRKQLRRLNSSDSNSPSRRISRRSLSDDLTTVVSGMTDSQASICRVDYRVAAKVSFSTITVREYQMILGDNPASRAGPSISIDWDFSEIPTVQVDAFERLRKNARRSAARHMLRSKGNRERLAQRLGYSKQEISEHVRGLNKTRHERRQTLNGSAGFPISSLVKSIFRKNGRQ